MVFHACDMHVTIATAGSAAVPVSVIILVKLLRLVKFSYQTAIFQSINQVLSIFHYLAYLTVLHIRIYL